MKHYILTDEELMELSELAPCTEGATLSDFLDEVKMAAQAVKDDLGALENEMARTLFLMRGVYFLGILRGGEAYRWTLQNDNNMEESEPMALALSESALYGAALELERLSNKELSKLWSALGLKVDNTAKK